MTMKTAQLLNYTRDQWIAGDSDLAELASAIDGAPVAMTGSEGSISKRCSATPAKWADRRCAS